MKDEDKSKEQLIDDLTLLRRRLAELETLRAERAQRERGEQAQVEKSLRQRNRELETLHRISQALYSSLDLDQVISKVLEETRALFDVTACSAWLLDTNSGELVCRQVTDPHGDIVRGWRLAPGQGLAGWAAQRGKSLIVGDIRADKRHFKGVDEKTGLTLRSILSLPLRTKQGHLGVIQIVDAKINRFTETDLTLLEPLTASAAIAIDNAQLYAALQESQEYTQNLIDRSLDAIISVNMEREVVEFNKAAQETFGYQPQEIVGKHVDILYEDNEQSVAIHKITVREGRCAQEILSKRKNGQVFHGFLSASVLRDANGELVGVMGVSRDITQQKQIERALQRHNQELALLNRASHAFISTLDLDEVLTSVLEEARQLLGVVACSIWLIDPQTNELVCRQLTNPQSEMIRGWRLPSGAGLVGWVASRGQSLITPDAQKDQRHFKGIDEQTGLLLHSILGIPLKVKYKVIGVLQAVDERIDRFQQTDLWLLESLAATAAIAIENARLYKQATQDAQTKLTLLHEVNHRVKNNLTAIIGLLHAEQKLVNADAQNTYESAMKDLINRVRGMAAVHTLLSASEWAPVYLTELAEHIIRSALQILPPGKRAAVVVSPSSARVTSRQASHLALVINELTTNSIKYAFSEGHNIINISVNIRRHRKRVHFEYRDNGPGYPLPVLQNDPDHCNVGFDLINNIVRRSLPGDISLRNDEGAVAAIQFELEVTNGV